MVVCIVYDKKAQIVTIVVSGITIKKIAKSMIFLFSIVPSKTKQLNVKQTNKQTNTMVDSSYSPLHLSPH